MASGPEHYREAELILSGIAATPEDSVGSVRTAAIAAQVHATLALAAATADPFARQPEWAEALQ